MRNYTKEMNRQFTKEKLWVTNKHMEKYARLVSREMYIKVLLPTYQNG